MGVYGEHQNYSFGFRASVSSLCRPPKPSVMRVATTSPYGWSGKKQGWSSGGCTVEVSQRSEEIGSLSCLSLGRTRTHQMCVRMEQLKGEPKLQVGDVYTPTDAIVQGLKTLALNETKILAISIAGCSSHVSDVDSEENVEEENLVWVDERAKETWAKYDGYLVEKYGDELSNHPKFDEVLWSRAAGGKNKRKVYGLSCVNDSNAHGRQNPEVVLHLF
ncbi:hypothetical protein E3N88_00103 [Mikania micrantha]|uniref:Uncharacterized protein n=1 Tax=Mikania micrantha TaxID=192012 RepID=A0A5N6PYJ6_9ASTR|nr:hypothetical protein E3N88_00103 [Mikania micrantha]